jgi:hypothetical protein
MLILILVNLLLDDRGDLVFHLRFDAPHNLLHYFEVLQVSVEHELIFKVDIHSDCWEHIMVVQQTVLHRNFEPNFLKNILLMQK